MFRVGGGVQADALSRSSHAGSSAEAGVAGAAECRGGWLGARAGTGKALPLTVAETALPCSLRAE